MQASAITVVAPVAATAALLLLLALGLRAAARTLTRPVARGISAALTLLPLLFVAPGLIPGRTLAGTRLLGEYVPWRTAEFRSVAASGGPTNPLLADVVTLYEPWRAAAREGVSFFPSQFGGSALLGNGHSAALFPLEVVARLLPESAASAFVQAARLLVAAWGFFVLMRVLGIGPRGALIGALAFVGSGYLELWRAHVNASAVAIAPWLLAGATRLLRRPGSVPAVVTGVAGGGVVLAGHPQSVAFIGLATLLVALPAAGKLRRRPVPRLAWIAVAGVLGALLSAPVAVPFVQNLRVSTALAVRAGRTAAPRSSVYPHLSERILLPSLHHLVFGDPRDGTWSGVGNLIEVGGGSVGTGALALIPAAFAVRRRRRLAAGWLALGLAGLVVAAGLPFVGRLYDLLPAGGLIQQHRLTLLWCFAAAALAGVGSENVLRGAGRNALAAGAVTMAMVLAVLAGAFPVLRRPVVWGVEPVALAALAFASTRGAAFWRFSSLAVGVLLPRVAFFSTWIPAAPVATFYPETPAVQYVRDRAAGFRVAGLRHALLPASAALFGLEDVRGYDPMALRPYVDFVSALGSTEDSVVPRLSDATHPALRFLGVRFVFAEPDARPSEGWTTAYRGPDAAVFENTRALPRAFVPRRVERSGDESAAVRRALSIRDPEDAVVELVAGGCEEGASPNGPAEVRSLAVGRGRIEARVAGSLPFLLATSQPAIPGWRLTVDGVQQPGSIVNGAFLGARLAAGVHVVRFEYRPATVPAGLALGGLGLLLVVALAGGRSLSRRPASGPGRR